MKIESENQINECRDALNTLESYGFEGSKINDWIIEQSKILRNCKECYTYPICNISYCTEFKTKK